MAKLSQDEIKWILSIDAKGVNKEIAATSSEIQKLTADNKRMNTEMKDAEKQMNKQETMMQRLAAAGKEESTAYKEAQAQMQSARAEIDSYIQKIGDNTRAIEDNQKSIEKMTAEMDINEMSMKQLRQRAGDLQKQLAVTSLAANPEEYKGLQKELTNVYSRMGEVRNSGRSMVQQLSVIPGPAGMAAKSITGLGNAMKILIANPIGAIITVIVAAFLAMKKAISGSEEATAKLSAVMAPFRVLMDNIMNVVQKLVKGFLDLTLAFMGWASKALENIPFIGKYMGEMNDKAREGVEIEKEKLALSIRERESLVTNAEKQREIARLRNEARQRENFTNEEIIEKLETAIQLEREIAEEKIEQAKAKLNLLELENRHADNTAETNRLIAEQKALVIGLETEYYNATRRMESEINTRRKEQRTEGEAAAKAALEKRISDIDHANRQELLLLKQQLADRLISESDYNRQSEQLALGALQRKLEIAGLDRDKRMEIEQQVLDYKLQALKQEEEFEKERTAIHEMWRVRSLDNNEQELAAITAKYDKELELLKQQQADKLISETEYIYLREQALTELDREIAEKRKEQEEKQATEQLAKLMQQKELERMSLQQSYNSGLLDKQTYNDALLQLDTNYHQLSLELENLTATERRKIQQESLDAATKMMEAETAKQEQEQQKRTALYNKFSEQIGTTLGAFVADNENLMKSSLRNIINMALDALEAQITMSIASATAQSLAQADSVATFGAAGLARAAVLTALIKGAFAGVKAVVNSSLSGSKSKSHTKTTTSTTGGTGSRTLIGRQSGGYMNVSRAQDGKKYRALFNPNLRGFVNRPTVLVGDGPVGQSREWVASNDALQNPTIAPLIDLLNEAQLSGNIRTIDMNHIMRSRMAGFESGGYTSPAPVSSSPASSGSDNVVNDIRDLLQHLKDNGVKAPVVLSDLQRQQELLKTSQKFGSK